MSSVSQENGVVRLHMTKEEWESIGETKGWLDTQDVRFQKKDFAMLLGKLYGKGLAGRMAINMLRAPVQREAIEAIMDIMSYDWSYWKNVLQSMRWEKG